MDRKPHVRPLLFGLVGGVLLSFARVPLGIDWTQVQAVEGVSAGLVRAAALLVLALTLAPASPLFRDGLRWSAFLGLVTGFLLHAFLAPEWMEPASRVGVARGLFVGFFLLLMLRGRGSTPAEGPERRTRAESVGLALAGLGAALALEGLAREIRQLAPFPGGDDVVALVALGLIGAAAISFGPLLRRAGPEPLRVALGAGLAAGATLAGLSFLSRLTQDGLHAYLRRFDENSAWVRALDGWLGDPLGLKDVPVLGSGSVGTLWVTALLGAASLVVPLFVLGASLGGTRDVGRIRALLVGAGLGLLLEPSLIHAVARPIEGPAVPSTPWAWNWTLGGASLAAAGILLVGWGTAGRRAIGLAAALVVAAVPWIRPRLVVWTFSPWSIAPIEPVLVQPTAAGLVTVERARDGTPIVTLDRRRMSPIADEETVDAQRLQQSFALLPAAVRTGRVRTLFVGALTPSRAHALGGLGDLAIDRTVPWYEASEAVEALLFAGEAPPPGDRIEPARARARLSSGEYDWVIVPPVSGPILSWRSEAREPWSSAEAPRLHRLKLESGVGVAWVMADSASARTLPDGLVLPWMQNLEGLALGWVVGDTSDSPGGPLLLPTGEPLDEPTRAEVLRLLPQQRGQPLEAAVGRRLGSAGRALEDDPVRTALAEGLERHLAAQVTSSPFETRAQQIEIDEDALRAFQRAAAASPGLDPFQRSLWEGLAWLTVEKRLPEEALVYLEPVADRFQPWPALDRAVARAYLEVLEPEEALRLLERASASVRDIELLTQMGEVAAGIGQVERAAGYWEEALALQPGNPRVLRAYGLARLENGDPGGREMLERYLASFPDDEAVRAALSR